MAYVALKRNFEWDPLQNRDRNPKRRRCLLPMFPSSNVFKSASENQSSMNKVIQKLTSEQAGVNSNHEIKKRRGKRQLFCNDNAISGHPSLPAASPNFDTGIMSPDNKERPLLTYKQVILICENILKERENELRVEYDRILNTKLDEQYDNFVRFTEAQIQNRYGNRTSSYLS